MFRFVVFHSHYCVRKRFFLFFELTQTLRSFSDERENKPKSPIHHSLPAGNVDKIPLIAKKM